MMVVFILARFGVFYFMFLEFFGGSSIIVKIEQLYRFHRSVVWYHEGIWWDALPNLVPFEQFKKRKKHPWRSVEVCNFTKSNTSPCVFFTFLKLYNWYQIVQSIKDVTSSVLVVAYSYFMNLTDSGSYG